MTHSNTARARHTARVHSLGFIALLAGACLTAHADSSAVLATQDQRQVEALADKIFASSALQKELAVTTKQFAANPIATTADGKKTLPNAVAELGYFAALTAANSDADRPKLNWTFVAPHVAEGRQVRGSRWGVDNPDNVYRVAPIDARGKYELNVRPNGAAPLQYSFFLYDSLLGEDGKFANLDKPLGGLRNGDIQANADGSFTITIDNAAAEGRKNHIRSTADTNVLMIRNTLADWNAQSPFAVSVKRVGGPTPRPARTEAELTAHAVKLLQAGTQTVLRLADNGVAGAQKLAAKNTIAPPFVRGGGWGFAAQGAFDLKPDEALVVTLDPLGGKYLGFDLTTPWLVSLEHVRGSGSLNSKQAEANKDGTYTYVVAAQDPGVRNWVDTEGLHQGQIWLRWQVLPESTRSADGAVRAVKVVKLSELDSALPAGTQRVSAAQRQQLQRERVLAYAHRYGDASFEPQRVAAEEP